MGKVFQAGFEAESKPQGMLHDEELRTLAKQPGSMVFGLLIGMVVDYEQTVVEGQDSKSRNVRNKKQFQIVNDTEQRIRKVVRLGLMDEIIELFAEQEGAKGLKSVTEKKFPITYRLGIMREELMRK